MRSVGWHKPLKVDLFPYREQPGDVVRESIDTLTQLAKAAERLPADQLRAAQESHDAMAATRLVRAALLG